MSKRSFRSVQVVFTFGCTFSSWGEEKRPASLCTKDFSEWKTMGSNARMVKNPINLHGELTHCPIKTSPPLASSPRWSAGVREASSDVSLSTGLNYVRTPSPAGDRAAASRPDLSWSGVCYSWKLPPYSWIYAQTVTHTGRQADRQKDRPTFRLSDLGKLCKWLWECVFFEREREHSLFELFPIVKCRMLTCCMCFCYFYLWKLDFWMLHGK